jgi:sulfofructose kinase
VTRVLCVGHAVQDFVFTLPRLPDRAAKYRADGFASVGGGPAATAAAAIARLGATPLLAARLGDDAVAGVIEAELKSYGVDCRYLRRFAGCVSSLSAVLLDARGERLVVNHGDPALPADATWLPDPLQERVAAVLADSRWPEGAAHVLARARAAGLPAVLDADRPFPAHAGLLESASHIAFSADGLEDHARSADAEAAIAAVSRRSSAWCCVTLGERGVLIAVDGNVTHQPAFAVPAVDTLGAGDVWHGAFALALAEGQRAEAACRFASAAAAVKVQRRGGRAGVPTRNEVDVLLTQVQGSDR